MVYLAAGRGAPACAKKFSSSKYEETGVMLWFEVGSMVTVADLMNESLHQASASTTVAEAATMMARGKVGSVLIMDGPKLLGIFTERDIVRALSHSPYAPADSIGHWMTAHPRTVVGEQGFGGRAVDGVPPLRAVDGQHRARPQPLVGDRHRTVEYRGSANIRVGKHQGRNGGRARGISSRMIALARGRVHYAWIVF